MSWQSKVYKPMVDHDLPENWKEIRRRIIKRDNQHCFRCDEKLMVKELTIHHIMPRADGGTHEDNNLMALCTPCHDYVELHDLRTKAEIMGSYEDLPVGVTQGQEQKDDENRRIETFDRPSWHARVYGGARTRD